MKRIGLRSQLPRIAVGAIAAGALGVAACGGSDEDGASPEAPAATDFPAPEGRTLEEIVGDVGLDKDVVVSPAGRVADRGENRLGFGVFTSARDPIDDARIAIYAAPGERARARGPFPARVESLETKPAYESETTSSDPHAPKVVYISEVDFDSEGEWRLIALVDEGGTYKATRIPSIVAGQFTNVPGEGDKAPTVHTPTAEDTGGDLSPIETRNPPDTMHEHDLADVLGNKPVALLFATPALCQSRVCGPVVDVAEQVKDETGDDVAFIHMEIFEDNSFEKGPRPQVEAYKLPTEPWLFVIDRKGRIDTAIEGAFSADELRDAIDKVKG